jgi:hypothetical protein
MKKQFLSMLRIWLPLTAAVTLGIGLAYGLVQQDLRQTANDPQVQMAEDAARLLSAGADPQQVVGTARVELSQSLAPYLMVFDAQGSLLASSAQLHGQAPQVPQGALEAARRQGQNRVTWQPEPGVRGATVIVPFDAPRPGTVLAGRSLREIERRADDILLLAVLGGAATVAAVTVVCGGAGALLRPA